MNGMLVVLDGPDCAGKSTLSRKLIELSGSGKYAHLTYRWPKGMHTYHTAALRHCIRNLTKYPIVTLDRSWLSEDIYARIYRNGSDVPMSGRILQKWLDLYGAQTIICSDDPDVIAARHAKLKETRVEMYNGRMDMIADMYNKAYFGDYSWDRNRTYLDLLIHNGGLRNLPNTHYYKIGHDIDALFARLKVNHNKFLYNRPVMPHFALGGNLAKAKVLIVGDKANHPKPERHGPFMYHKNSSLFLAQALQANGILENELAYYNVNDAPQLATKVLSIFGNDVVVLGKDAQATLMNINKDFGNLTCIPHPSWARRFSNLEAYTAMLAEALTNKIL